MAYNTVYSGGVVNVPARGRYAVGKNAVFLCPVCGLPKKYTEGVKDWRGVFVCRDCNDLPPAFARKKKTYHDVIALENPRPITHNGGYEKFDLKGVQSNFEIGNIYDFTVINNLTGTQATFSASVPKQWGIESIDGVQATFSASSPDVTGVVIALIPSYRLTDEGDSRITDEGDYRITDDSYAAFGAGTFVTTIF